LGGADAHEGSGWVTGDGHVSDESDAADHHEADPSLLGTIPSSPVP
jgi:hypothetical protein